MVTRRHAWQPPMHEAVALLRRMGLGVPGGEVKVVPLSGGVSSDIWRVGLGGADVVVKRPRRLLAVADEWQAPLDRGASEVAWLGYASEVVPGCTPTVLGFDAETFAIALEYLQPNGYPNWKQQLLSGTIDPGVAARLGGLLARIHSASAGEPELAERFDNQHLFEELRIEPYLRRSAAAVPDAREAMDEVIAGLEETRIGLVHGDLSPKNILVGEGGARPVILDAECATWGDPAFDTAFCVSHLVIKELHLPRFAPQLRAAARAFEHAYLSEATWGDSLEVAARVARIVPALVLARMKGASPVEYLEARERAELLELAVAALRERRPIWDLMDSRRVEGT